MSSLCFPDFNAPTFFPTLQAPLVSLLLSPKTPNLFTPWDEGESARKKMGMGRMRTRRKEKRRGRAAHAMTAEFRRRRNGRAEGIGGGARRAVCDAAGIN